MTFDEFLAGVVSDCVNGSSGRVYGREPLPSLEEPPAGTTCERCGAEIHLIGPPFCGECGK